MADAVTSESALVVLGSEVGADGRPGFVPALVAGDRAEREHRIDVPFSPVHPTALESGFHDDLIGTLDGATPDRIAGRSEARVVKLRGTGVQIAKRGVPRGAGQGRVSGLLKGKLP